MGDLACSQSSASHTRIQTGGCSSNYACMLTSTFMSVTQAAALMERVGLYQDLWQWEAILVLANLLALTSIRRYNNLELVVYRFVCLPAHLWKHFNSQQGMPK